MARARLFRKEERTASAADDQQAATSSAVAVTGSAGRPLSGVQQRQVGNWFGTDFSDVRIHDDIAAGDAAGSIGARAYTVGSHIVFGSGELAGGGNRLLAHELAHVVQNRSSGPATEVSRLSEPADPAERAADAVADRIGTGLGAAGPASTGPSVARAVAGDGGSTESTEPAAGPADEVQDGDSPAGGPILDVPESPADLATDAPPAEGEQSAEAGPPPVQLAAAQLAAAPVQLAAAPVQLTAGPVRRQRRQPAAPPPTNRTPLPIPTTARRWITRIDISLAVPQTITVHWSDGSPNQSSAASSGRGRPCTSSPPCPGNNGLNCTPDGTFHPAFRGDANFVNGHGDHMSYYVDLGVMDAQGNNRGIGIHNSQIVTGSPASHGCIRVPEWMARLVNGNVIRATDVVISGVAPAVAYRDRSCPAPPPSRTRPHAGAPVHRSQLDGASSPLAELAIPSGPAPIRLTRLDVGNGRTISDSPGPAANTREDVLQVMDRMHLLWLLTNADYAAEYPIVSQQPPGSEVASSRIGRLTRAIDRMPAADSMPAPVASALFGISLTGGVGPGQPNHRADVITLIHAMHAAWDLHEAPPLAFADAMAEVGSADPVNPSRLVITRQAIQASYSRYVRGFPGAGAAQTALPAIPVPSAGAPAAGTRTTGGAGLSWELTDAPAGPNPRARVGAWLTRYSGVISAAETRHGVDRRAIAAAIAWEALNNVAASTAFRQWSGPGKVHGSSYTGTTAAEQTETLGYLPHQASESARLTVLSDPVSSISYIAAIMQASADAADAGGYNLRADTPMLCFLYHAWDIDRSRGYFGVVKRSPAPLGYTGSAMAVWIADATNLAFVTAAVGSPSSALSVRPRGY